MISITLSVLLLFFSSWAEEPGPQSPSGQPRPVNVKAPLSPAEIAKNKQIAELLAQKNVSGAEVEIDRIVEDLLAGRSEEYSSYYIWNILIKKLLINYSSARPTAVSYSQLVRWLDKYFPNSPPDFKTVFNGFPEKFSNMNVKRKNYFLIYDDFIKKFMPTYARLNTSPSLYVSINQNRCDHLLVLYIFDEARKCVEELSTYVQAHISKAGIEASDLQEFKGYAFNLEIKKGVIERLQNHFSEAEQIFVNMDAKYPPDYNKDFAKLALWETYGAQKEKCKLAKSAVGERIRSKQMNDSLPGWYYFVYVSLTNCIENLDTELKYAEDMVADMSRNDNTVLYRGIGLWFKARLLYAKGDTAGAISHLKKALEATALGSAELRAHYNFDLSLLSALAGKPAEAAEAAKEFAYIVNLAGKLGKAGNNVFSGQMEILKIITTQANEANFKEKLRVQLETFSKQNNTFQAPLRIIPLVLAKDPNLRKS